MFPLFSGFCLTRAGSQAYVWKAEMNTTAIMSILHVVEKLGEEAEHGNAGRSVAGASEPSSKVIGQFSSCRFRGFCIAGSAKASHKLHSLYATPCIVLQTFERIPD